MNYDMIKWKSIEDLAKKDIATLVFNSELNFNMQVHNIADSVCSNKSIKLVLVAGPSASGKTTFSNLLAERLMFKGINVQRISLDDFFYNREDIEFLPSGLRDYDSLKALDMNTLRAVLHGILAGEAVEIPQFDFTIGRRCKETSIMYVQSDDVVIIEGIHALNPVLFDNLTVNGHVLRISIAPRREFCMPGNKKISPNDLRLLRRMIRDYYTRGHDVEDTARQWKEVLLAEQKYVLPFMENAHFLVDSVYDYELFVYKHCFYEKLAKNEVAAISELREALGAVADISVPSIPSSSLINEFVFYG